MPVIFVSKTNEIVGTLQCSPILNLTLPLNIRNASRKTPMTTASRRSNSRLDTLRKEAADCRACPLWKDATQTVFGEGPQAARIMLVGEQPGDKEDLAGKPFVGPAGQLAGRPPRQGRHEIA